MKIIPIVQGTPKWLEWRKSHVTATDAACILGLNEYKSINELWAEKVGLELPSPVNDAMLRGQALEPEARARFIEETGIDVAPAVVEHSDYWWIGASLDGISTCGRILLEIKCPGHRNHIFSLDIGIREYWYAQMQHQLFVTGASICYFMSYNPDFEEGRKHIIREVLPDDSFVRDMIEAEEEFYNINMLTLVAPGQLLQA